MLFIRQEKLKTGMRLAKPIYDKKGVLLYDRNSKLTEQGIESVRNFNIIGLYILEPAEPLPPMTEEDMEFERFQMMSTFQIKDEWKSIRAGKSTPALASLAAQVIKRYGHLDHKLNFVQSLRSQEDKYYKHCLNVAILCALITHKMNVRPADQNDIITAALVHDIGKLDIKEEIDESSDLNDELHEVIYRYECKGHKYLEDAFRTSQVIRRLSQQSSKLLYDVAKGKTDPKAKIMPGARIIMVADMFDTMTAMNDYREPSSEIAAIRYLIDNPELFDKNITDAIIASINILVPGCSVELSNGDKALVINENQRDILRPVLLLFRDNSIVDLDQKLIYGNLEIKDVMKSLDNRCIIDREALKGMGFSS